MTHSSKGCPSRLIVKSADSTLKRECRKLRHSGMAMRQESVNFYYRRLFAIQRPAVPRPLNGLNSASRTTVPRILKGSSLKVADFLHTCSCCHDDKENRLCCRSAHAPFVLWLKVP